MSQWSRQHCESEKPTLNIINILDEFSACRGIDVFAIFGNPNIIIVGMSSGSQNLLFTISTTHSLYLLKVLAAIQTHMFLICKVSTTFYIQLWLFGDETSESIQRNVFQVHILSIHYAERSAQGQAYGPVKEIRTHGINMNGCDFIGLLPATSRMRESIVSTCVFELLECYVEA